MHDVEDKNTHVNKSLDADDTRAIKNYTSEGVVTTRSCLTEIWRNVIQIMENLITKLFISTRNRIRFYIHLLLDLGLVSFKMLNLWLPPCKR